MGIYLLELYGSRLALIRALKSYVENLNGLFPTYLTFARVSSYLCLHSRNCIDVDIDL